MLASPGMPTNLTVEYTTVWQQSHAFSQNSHHWRLKKGMLKEWFYQCLKSSELNRKSLEYILKLVPPVFSFKKCNTQDIYVVVVIGNFIRI